MRQFRNRLLVWAVATAILMLASPDEARADAGEAKQLIVMINGEIQGRQVIGSGIIIGSGADRLYIATANHVVRQGPKKLEQVQVRFKFLPGQEIGAEVLSDFDRDLDLAVLSVKGVQALAIPLEEIPFQLVGTPAGLKRGDEVFTIGYPRGTRWQVNVSPDLIAGTIGDKLEFESQLVANGHSGGGLFDRDWNLVGMITADQPPNGVAVRIDRVIQQMKRWDYPVELTRREPETPPPAQDTEMAGIIIAEMDETYYALKNANVRSGPGTTFKKVARLTVGDEVEVTGKVRDKTWLRIALKGGKEAFVYARLLSPEMPENPSASAPPSEASHPPTETTQEVLKKALADYEAVQAIYIQAKAKGQTCVHYRNVVEKIRLHVGNPRLVPESFRYSVKFPSTKDTPTISDLATDRILRIKNVSTQCFSASQSQPKLAQRPYANVKIRQMGRVTLEYEEFAQAAARNALDSLTKAGVPEAALISAEINGRCTNDESAANAGR